MSATEAPAHAPSVDAVQRRRGRRRTRRVLTRLHRWAALLAGVILLVVTLSGVALIFEPELDTVLHPSLYQSTRSAHPIAPEQAVAVVRRELPDFGPVDVVANRGVYEVYGRDYVRQAHIDPGSGRLLGVGNHDAGVMGFLKNLHMCALTCEEYPAHIGLLSTATPILGNDDLTVGGLLVVAVAILLVGLCLSGLVLWWPGARRVARGLRIRRGKGRYALHYDLHKVIGFAAIPFLLMWAITGAGFEVKQVEQAWYALLPGKRPPEYRAMQSRPQPDRAVDQRQARQIAERTLPDYRIVSVSVPDHREKTSAYSIYMSPRAGIDPTAHASWSGTTEVGVDRYSGRAAVAYGGPGRPISQQLWEDWQFYGHAGYFFGPWPRTLWLVLGLTPLLLAVTGVTTWLIRRRKRRAKRRMKPAPA